ncbi:MAG: proton-conducting transporter transmembrane domain-containing protein [Anaplasma sp.]
MVHNVLPPAASKIGGLVGTHLPAWLRNISYVPDINYAAVPLFLSFTFVLFLILYRAWGTMRPGEVLGCLLYYASSSAVLASSDLTLMTIGFEVMALSAMFIIAHGNSNANSRAFLHYAIVHFVSGVLLLLGACQFAKLGQLDGIPRIMYMAGLLINAASFPLSSWVSHAYPESSRFGIMVLSTFTTKVAAYVLLLMFAGDQVLLYIGVLTAAYGAIFAWLEADIRKAMSYNVVGQMGLLLLSIGFAKVSSGVIIAQMVLSVLYQTLLFMVADSLVVANGGCTKVHKPSKTRCPMPLEALCCIIAVFNMSAFPGSAGFVIKSLILHNVAVDGFIGVLLKQVFVICSMILVSGVGLRLFWCFLAQERKMSFRKVNIANVASTAPLWMLAITLLVLGVFHGSMLMSSGQGSIYTTGNVVPQVIAVMLTIVCFSVLRGRLIGRREFLFDVDWVYMDFIPKVFLRVSDVVSQLCSVLLCLLRACAPGLDCGEEGSGASVLTKRLETSNAALLLCMLLIGIMLVWVNV